MDRKKIFYVSAISLEKITEENLKKKYEIYKIKYDKNISYERYIQMAKSWGETKYNIDSFISSYHTSEEEATEYAVENIGDINEAGCYEYVGITDAPIGVSYYNTYINSEKDIRIFKYDREKDKYNPFLKEDDPEIYEYIKYHLWGMVKSDE